MYSIKFTEYSIIILAERFISVYHLVLDAKPDRVMLWLAENTRACSEDFQTGTVSMARQSHFASSARGFSCFCFSLDDTGVAGKPINSAEPHVASNVRYIALL